MLSKLVNLDLTGLIALLYAWSYPTKKVAGIVF